MYQKNISVMYLKAFRHVLICAACVLLFYPSGCKARNFKSQILDERRTYFIHLPQDYALTDTALPVLYILDAYNKPSTFGPSFSETTKGVEEMRAEGIPAMIVVGIKNTHRDRDMLPVQSGYISGEGGGADRFLLFLVEELIPCIDRDYRTSEKRILYGRSDSGLFVLYALAKNPDSFAAYISASPTIGHCPNLLEDKFTELFDSAQDLDNSLYILYGEKDIPLAKDFIPDLVEIIKTCSSPDFRFQSDIVPGEGHIPASILRQGLRFIFLR